MNVSVVIPNWNGRLLLAKHLPSVRAAVGKSEIIVSDDCSSDDSVSFLRRTFPDIRIIEKFRHDGFASTVNAGVHEASGEIVILINTDIKPEQNFLAPLLRHFSDPQVFAVGCLDRSVEGKKTVLRGRGLARWDKGFFIHRRGEVDRTDTVWVSGGSGAFRKSIWQELGGMDERFNPFYWEDIDLSYRAVQAGYTVLFEPGSVVWHYHEIGKIKSDFTPEEIKRIAYRNQFLFMFKHAPPGQRLQQLVYVPTRLLSAGIRGDISMIRGFAGAVGRVFA